MTAPVAPKNRVEFVNTKHPPSYVADLGRVETGSTTRSKIGPGEEEEFEGNDVGLFASAEYRAANLKITKLFADIKRKFAALYDSEWDNIPYNSLRNKKKRYDTMQEKEHVTALDCKSRGTVLSLKLDKFWDPVLGLTGDNPICYSTYLERIEIASRAKKKIIKKARRWLKAEIEADPLHSCGWIAAARLEVVAGKIDRAREMIRRGCEYCPKSENVWIEACELANQDEAKGVVARGVKEIPNSVKLWMHAAKLERDDANKSNVLRKGLENIPDSVRLWKAVVEIANEDDAKILLNGAVMRCPLSVELWLALARLEKYDAAKKVLNKAREKLPREPAIWITTAKLEEAFGSTSMVGKIIERGVRALQSERVEIDWEAWMKEAEAAERAGSVATCKAIISNTIGKCVWLKAKYSCAIADAEECKRRGSIETARAIYSCAIAAFKSKKSVWLKAAQLEKDHGTRESLDALLHKAVTYVPQAEVLWLMGAKEKWLAGDVPAARHILQEAYAAIPKSEEILLAAFKLEFENNESERARMLLAKARERGGTERVWMKSAIVERELGNSSEERRLLDEGLRLFPSFFKLWLMLGQLEERLGWLPQAKEAYEMGIKQCPMSTPLSLSLANIEERMSRLSKVRALLTMAIKCNPHNPELWLAAVRAESKHGSTKEAEILMAKGLQECPNSGILWAAAIEMAPRPQRKTISLDAYKKCEHDPHVIAAIGKLFWHDRQVDKARTWLNQAVTLAPDVGDFWAWLYRFEVQHGSEHQQKEVLRKCIAAEPKHGEKWQPISKAVENSHQPVEDILKKLVVALEKEQKVAEDNKQ